MIYQIYQDPKTKKETDDPKEKNNEKNESETPEVGMPEEEQNQIVNDEDQVLPVNPTDQ